MKKIFAAITWNELLQSHPILTPIFSIIQLLCSIVDYINVKINLKFYPSMAVIGVLFLVRVANALLLFAKHTAHHKELGHCD